MINLTTKASGEAIAKLENNPTWGCEVSEFGWYYSNGKINGKLFTLDFADRLIGGYRFLMPFYDYFAAAENRGKVC